MSNIKTKVLSFGICALCLFWILCFDIYHSVFAQDKIIAIVNNDCITQKDLDSFVNFTRIQLSKQYNDKELEKRLESVREELLEKLIEDRLILQEARKNDYKIEVAPKAFISIKPDEGRVKAKVNEIRARYPSDSDFQKGLMQQGMVQADLEEKIREQLLMYNIVEYKIRKNIVVRPQEVTAFYQKNIREFIAPEERELEVIALENEGAAKSFAYDLTRGEKIADLASRYPISLNTIKVSRTGELRKEVVDSAFRLGIGEVSGPLKIDNKYYVFVLNNILPENQLKLQQVQDKIHSYLYDLKTQEKLESWISELKAKAFIKITGDVNNAVDEDEKK